MSKEIKNMIHHIFSKDLNIIKNKQNSSSNILIVEIDGVNINSWEEYISQIQSKFKFPTPCYDSIDRYLDWMTDLEWLNAEGFILIINNFKDFFKDNPRMKNIIISSFENNILPFWQDEVRNVVVEGNPKSFMVYLVD